MMPRLFRSSLLLTRKISREQFFAGVRALGLQITDEKLGALFAQVDVDKSGDIDIIEWIEQLQPNNPNSLPFFSSSYTVSDKELLPALRDSEIKQMLSMVKRLEMLATTAAEAKVRLMIDAEQTYFQPAIDHFALQLQRKFNRDFPIIYTTFQCYLVDTVQRLALDIERAKRYVQTAASKQAPFGARDERIVHFIPLISLKNLVSVQCTTIDPVADGGSLPRSFVVRTWFKSAKEQVI
jgi:hypothetical protein